MKLLMLLVSFVSALSLFSNQEQPMNQEEARVDLMRMIQQARALEQEKAQLYAQIRAEEDDDAVRAPRYEYGDDCPCCKPLSARCYSYECTLCPKPAYRDYDCQWYRKSITGCSAITAIIPCMFKGMDFCGEVCCNHTPSRQVCDNLWFPPIKDCKDFCGNNNHTSEMSCFIVSACWCSSLTLMALPLTAGFSWAPCINQKGCNCMQCTKINHVLQPQQVQMD